MVPYRGYIAADNVHICRTICTVFPQGDIYIEREIKKKKVGEKEDKKDGRNRERKRERI